MDARAAASWMTVLGRLRPGTERAQAASRLKALFPGTSWTETPDAVTSLNAAAIPQIATGSPLMFPILIAVTVGLLLAIGCLAAGVLLLLRTEGRRDEFATCLALGASRGRLIHGVVVEGGLLALAGLLLALPAFAWLQTGTRAFELPGGLQVDLGLVSVDLLALLVAGAAALVATLVISIAAGSFVLSVNAACGPPQANVTPPPAHGRTRTFLAVGQVAISLVLLAGAALFARSISGTLAFGPGEDVRRLVTGTINPLAYRFTDKQASAFFDELQQRLRSHPAIDAVSIAKPYTNSQGGVTFVNGAPLQIPSYIYYQGIDEQYFSMLGQPVVAGREFSVADRAESQPVAIVSASLGRVLAPGADPIGRTLGPIFWSKKGTATIVGVVPDVVTNVALRSTYVVYMPVTQMPGPTPRTLFLRTANPAIVIADVVSAIRTIDPAIVPPPLQTIRDRLDEQMRAQRFGMFAMGGVGVASTLLTALGTYVLAASLAMRRRRELAIRSALGAPRAHIGLIVLRESGLVALVGIFVGVVIVWAGVEFIRTFLFQIEPFDPLSIASAATLLLVLVLTVGLKAARAAMRMDVARILAEQ
jgi:predicted permease